MAENMMRQVVSRVETILDDTPIYSRIGEAESKLAEVSEGLRAFDAKYVTTEAAIRGVEEKLVTVATLSSRVEKLEAELAAKEAELEKRIAAIKTPAPCEINVLDAGCQINNGDFDNGPPLNTLLAKIAATYPGTQASNFCSTRIYIPGGALCFSTPLVTPHMTGLRIGGNGAGQGINEDAYWGPNPRRPGGPVSRLVYLGPPTKPALTMRGFGAIVDGIQLQHGFIPNPAHSAKPVVGSVGIQVTGEYNPPTAKHEFRNLSLACWDRGFSVTGEEQGDTVTVGKLRAENCRTIAYFDNPQAVGWHFGHLSSEWGVDTLFEIKRGGRLSIRHLGLMAPSLIFKLHRPTVNTSAFEIGFLEADCGGQPGWGLVETVGKGYCLQLTVGAGMISNGARPRTNAVSVDVQEGGADISARLLDSKTCRQWAYEIKK